MNLNPIPDGYKQDTQGKLVPLSLVKPIDIERDDLVRGIVTRAIALQTEIRKFKTDIMGDIAAFIELSAEKYDLKMGGNKGNVTLMSFDGRYKVQRAIAENIHFDERLQVAKQLIDECIHEWSAGSRPEMQVLVNDAFQVNKQGHVSTTRILGLKRLDIDHPKWRQAMDAIADSITVSGSKTYVRIYERVGDTDAWMPVALDIAAL